MKNNYVLVAVTEDDARKIDEGTVSEEGGIKLLHMCFYENKPSPIDLEHLYEELETDEEFGMTDRDDYVILRLNEAQTTWLREMIGVPYEMDEEEINKFGEGLTSRFDQ